MQFFALQSLQLYLAALKKHLRGLVICFRKEGCELPYAKKFLSDSDSLTHGFRSRDGEVHSLAKKSWQLLHGSVPEH